MKMPHFFKVPSNALPIKAMRKGELSEHFAANAFKAYQQFVVLNDSQLLQTISTLPKA